jgi:hypothetical protein
MIERGSDKFEALMKCLRRPIRKPSDVLLALASGANTLALDRLSARLDLDQPQDGVAVALARTAHGVERSTAAASSQFWRSPLASSSRSKPTLLPSGSVSTIASKAAGVMPMRTMGLI